MSLLTRRALVPHTETTNMPLIFQGIQSQELKGLVGELLSKGMTNAGMELQPVLWRQYLARRMVLMSNMDFQITEHPNLLMLMCISSQHRVLQIGAAVQCLVAGRILRKRSSSGMI